MTLRVDVDLTMAASAQTMKRAITYLDLLRKGQQHPLLVSMDDQGYHIRRVLEVTRIENEDIWLYRARSIASRSTFHEAVFAVMIEDLNKEHTYPRR